MAYTSARSVGNGMYEFTDDTGGTVTLGGQAAADKAAQLGASAAPANPLASPPPGLSPSIVEAAQPPADDQRTASILKPGEQGALDTISNLYGRARSAMDAGAAREAAKGNFSGTPALDAKAASAAGVAPPSAGSGPQLPQISLPDQEITAEAPKGGAVDPRTLVTARSGGFGASQQTPARNVPAQWVPRGMNIEKGQEIPQDVKDRYERASLMEKHATEDEAYLAKERAEKEFAIQQGQQEAAAAAAAEQRTKARDQKAVMDRYQARYEQMADDIAQQKIDPNQFWASKDQATRNSIAIASAVGAMVKTVTGASNNDPMDVIDREISRNIDAQKANLANKHAALDAQGNLMGMARANFDRADQQDAATRALAYEAIKQQMATVAAQYKGPEQQAAFLKVQAGIEARRADYEKQLAQSTADHVTMTQQFVPQHTVGGGGIVGDKIDKDKVITLPNGQQAELTGKGAEKATEELAKMDQLDSALDRLAAFHAKYGSVAPDKIADRAAVAAAANDAKIVMELHADVIGHKGRLNDREAEAGEAAAGGDTGAVVNFSGSAAVARTKTQLGDTRNAVLRANGAIPVQSHVIQHPNGQRERVFTYTDDRPVVGGKVQGGQQVGQ